MSQQRIYTLPQANAMLPELTRLLTRIQDQARQQAMVQGRVEEVEQKVKSNGHHNPIEDPMVTHASASLTQGLEANLEQLQEWGIELKDLQTGLIDFPAMREGRVVYLCWRLGEPEVGYWHELETGFAGRQPVDDAFL
jgi:hypothetical protein